MTTFSIIFGVNTKYEVHAICIYTMEMNESEICDVQTEEQVKFIHHKALEEVGI